jgi:hypothetical protein
MRTRESIIATVVLALWIVAERLLLPDEAHGDSWWSQVPGFVPMFGLVISLVLIAIAKTLARLGLLQDEPYYDRDDDV